MGLGSVWWNDEVKTAFRRKEAAWKEVLAASDEEVKERCMECTERRRERLKSVYISKN